MRQRPWEDTGLLALIFSILVTGFLIEGLRIAATGDPWGRWSPIGWLLAQLFKAQWGVEAMRDAHRFLWWFHLGLTFGFIAWLPYTKLLHVFTAAANVFLRSLEPAGASLKPLDIEASEVLGVARVEDFTWKDLLDLDACTECGRCQQECPATA
ncbi:MAG: respiratory nitrate reductase subunit gamma, partial [candidate division WOR-3 bacterium]